MTSKSAKGRLVDSPRVGEEDPTDGGHGIPPRNAAQFTSGNVARNISATGSLPTSPISPPGTPGIGERLREKANHAYAIPGTRRTRVAAETIRDWLALYRSGGFEALYPKARVDRGRPRRLPPDIAELLVGLKDRAALALGQRPHRRRARARGRARAGSLDGASAALARRPSRQNAPASPSPSTGDASPSATPASCG